jgi:hypothetical protein
LKNIPFHNSAEDYATKRLQMQAQLNGLKPKRNEVGGMDTFVGN